MANQNSGFGRAEPAPAEDSEPAAIPATDSEAAEPAPTAASAEPAAAATPAAEPPNQHPRPQARARRDRAACRRLDGRRRTAEPPHRVRTGLADSSPHTGERRLHGCRRIASLRARPKYSPLPRKPRNAPDAPALETLFPGATPQPQSPEPSTDTDTERTEKLAFPTPPARTPQSAPRPVTLAQITLPPEPRTAGAPARGRPPAKPPPPRKPSAGFPSGPSGSWSPWSSPPSPWPPPGTTPPPHPRGRPLPRLSRRRRAAPLRCRACQFALRAADRDQRCASHAFGDAQASLQQTSCSGVRRASYAATVDGRGAAVTVGIVEFPDAAQAAAFKAVADTPGGGGILDLASETGKWGATPAPRFENAAYTSRLEGTSVRVVQAVWAPGPSTPDDPGLARAAKAALDLPAQ